MYHLVSFLDLRLSVFAGLDSSLPLPETTLFHQGVSLFHSLSLSHSFFLSLPIRTFRSITFPVYQHPPPFNSVSVSLSSPSPCLCLSRHSDSYRNRHSLPVCLPAKVEPSFTLFCLRCHFFLSVFGQWIRQQEARSHTHLYTRVHAFDSLLEMPRLDRECG